MNIFRLNKLQGLGLSKVKEEDYVNINNNN